MRRLQVGSVVVERAAEREARAPTVLDDTSSGLPGSIVHRLSHALTCILAGVSSGTVDDTTGKILVERAECLPRQE